MTGPFIPTTPEHRLAFLKKIADANTRGPYGTPGIAQEDLTAWEQRLSVEMKEEGLIRYYGMGFHALVAACRTVGVGDTKCGLALTEAGKEELKKGSE